jgi:hypothetical protein
MTVAEPDLLNNALAQTNCLGEAPAACPGGRRSLRFPNTMLKPSPGISRGISTPGNEQVLRLLNWAAEIAI